MFRSRALSYFLLFGFSVTILSVPFFWGLMRPVFDTRNPYTVIYGFLNLPVTLLFKGFTFWIAQLVWDEPTLSQIDLVSVDVSVVFWALIGFVVGMFYDARHGMRG